MADEPYSNRELDHKFNDIMLTLGRIEVQTKKHNGRLSKVERVLLVVGCISGTILLMNGSQLVSFILSVI